MSFSCDKTILLSLCHIQLNQQQAKLASGQQVGGLLLLLWMFERVENNSSLWMSKAISFRDGDFYLTK